MQLRVNLIKNKWGRKPSGKEEYAYIQKSICNAENIVEMDIEEFAQNVGNKGDIWKSSLMIGGAKNENFESAYVISLDFDSAITINDFLEISKELGLDPTFVYKTFSHTEEAHKFRAVWNLKEQITNAHFKDVIQKTIMEVFSDCDKACKDLSRLWVGGKELTYFNKLNFLDLDNLFNALVSTISEKEPTQVNRNIKAFCKKIGIHTFNNFPAILKSVENHEKSYILLYRELRENRQLFEVINYDNYEIFLTTSFDIQKNKSVSAKIQNIKGEKLKKTKIDFDKLSERCNLFNNFINNTQKLEHNEILHLSTNLYVFEGYPTILRENLNKYSYNNWQNKYNTYVSSVNYNYTPSQCENKCKYFNDCMNPLNIKQKYYQKEHKVKKLHDNSLISLEEGERSLNSFFDDIKNYGKDDVLLAKFPVGLGKTEGLNKIDLNNTIIGIPTHRLGRETFDRLKQNHKNLFYMKPLRMDNLTSELKDKINHLYDLGVAGKVKDLIFDEIKAIKDNFKKGIQKPTYYNDLIDYVEQLKMLPNQDSLLFTHHKISYGNLNSKIDTIILDEDFLKSFIQYDTYNVVELFSELGKVREWGYHKLKSDANYSILLEFLEELNFVMKKDSIWKANPLVNYSSEDVKLIKQLLTRFIMDKKRIVSINTNLFKIINCEYFCLKDNNFVHIVNGQALEGLKHYKLVVMSATLDEKIHSMFINRYLEGKTIYFFDCGNVEIKGEIICDCSYSFSRDALKNGSEKSKKKLDEILNRADFENVITFKSDDIINLDDYENKQKILNFGATEGIDTFKGQNLGIIGTPHYNSMLYEAYGVLINNGVGPKSSTWKVKEVQKNGYQFPLNTYESEDDILFTNIQLYFLESELLQASGRARALRTSAKVFVFSAIPLPNATLI